MPVADLDVDGGGLGGAGLELRGKSANHGQAWVTEDRKGIARLFKERQSVAELMERFGRTRGGIRSELIRQGLMERR